ncbi:MAG: GNAT family N-acetyltransferase [Pseudomonadota bacterium]
MIPTLTTKRLTLRGPAPRDWPGYCAFITSDRARYAGGVSTTPQAWRAFCIVLAHWPLRGFGMWAVTRTGDDTCLGFVGHWFPEGWAEREVGWILWPEAEGRGIGREAALAARRQAYGVLGWDTAVSYIHPANRRSRALAERLGAGIDTGARHNFDSPDVLVYRHPGPEGAA